MVIFDKPMDLFRQQLTNKEAFTRVLNTYRTHSFGTSVVDSLDLIYNDWYQRVASVQTLQTFRMKS